MNKQDAFIRTYSGGKVFFFEPEKSEITLQDLFHPLSMLCRFNGNCEEFYSVAQHSVLVADEIYKETKDKEVAFMGLAHDFSEAFISDIPSPFKNHFDEFKKVELRMEIWLAKWLGCNFPYDPIVKKHDLKALSTEMRDLMTVCDNENLPHPYEERIVPRGPAYSKNLIMEAYNKYR